MQYCKVNTHNKNNPWLLASDSSKIDHCHYRRGKEKKKNTSFVLHTEMHQNPTTSSQQSPTRTSEGPTKNQYENWPLEIIALVIQDKFLAPLCNSGKEGEWKRKRGTRGRLESTAYKNKYELYDS